MFGIDLRSDQQKNGPPAFFKAQVARFLVEEPVTGLARCALVDVGDFDIKG